MRSNEELRSDVTESNESNYWKKEWLMIWTENINIESIIAAEPITLNVLLKKGLSH